MQFDELKKFLIDKPGSKLELPFGPESVVFKVMGKMFIVIAWQSDPIFISIKTDPELGVRLREKYPAIRPGYHFNKHHWSTIILDGSLPDEKIYQLIDMSYDLIVKGLPRRLKTQYDRIIAEESY